MSESKLSLWERMVKNNANNDKLIEIDEAVAQEAYMSGMSDELKESKIGNIDALRQLGEYNKSFGYDFANTAMTSLAKHAKENEELNTFSLSYRSPLGIQYGADFARPTGDKVDKETWGESFRFRQGLDYDERIVTEVRESLGNMFISDDE